MTDRVLSRRDWLNVATAAAAGAVFARDSFAAAPGPAVTVYKDPNCGCCAKWVEHIAAAGFRPTVRDTDAMDAVKTRYGVPASLQSCHTAIVGRYVVEGHVPAGDITRLLRERPAVRGIAVGGMPVGSPGMEVPGRHADRYEVTAFRENGATSPFARH